MTKRLLTLQMLRAGVLGLDCKRYPLNSFQRKIIPNQMQEHLGGKFTDTFDPVVVCMSVPARVPPKQ